MIEKITLYVRSSDSVAIFHDSRSDVKALAKVLNTCIEKVNEIVDTVNEMQEAYK